MKKFLNSCAVLFFIGYAMGLIFFSDHESIHLFLLLSSIAYLAKICFGKEGNPSVNILDENNKG